jgi:hypothetical protein
VFLTRLASNLDPPASVPHSWDYRYELLCPPVCSFFITKLHSIDLGLTRITLPVKNTRARVPSLPLTPSTSLLSSGLILCECTPGRWLALPQKLSGMRSLWHPQKSGMTTRSEAGSRMTKPLVCQDSHGFTTASSCPSKALSPKQMEMAGHPSRIRILSLGSRSLFTLHCSPSFQLIFLKLQAGWLLPCSKTFMTPYSFAHQPKEHTQPMAVVLKLLHIGTTCGIF